MITYYKFPFRHTPAAHSKIIYALIFDHFVSLDKCLIHDQLLNGYLYLVELST